MAEYIKNPTSTATNSRINEIDIIRGLSLWGILIVNIGLFSFPMLYTDLSSTWSSPLDQCCIKLVHFFGEGKFVSVFSFLFGLGFTIFMRRAQLKTDKPIRLFSRRLFVLMFIGLLHGYFIWYGDVLFIYSLLGFILMLFWNSSPHTLLRWSFLLLIGPILFFIVGSLLFGSTFYSGAMDTSSASFINQHIQTYQQGSLSAIFQQNLTDLNTTRIGYLFISPQILAMFLLGAYAGVTRFFDNLEQNKVLIRNVQIGSLVIGLPIAIASTLCLGQPKHSFSYNMAELIGTYIAGPCIGVFYISSTLILLQKAKWRKILSPFANLGRMAATNYILQSIICTTIMYSYGFKLYGQLAPSSCLVLVAGVIAFQVLFSHIWLKYFKQGPIEQIWRYLTYK